MIWGVAAVVGGAALCHSDHYSDHRDYSRYGDAEVKKAKIIAKQKEIEAKKREIEKLKKDVENCYKEEVESLKADSEFGKFVDMENKQDRIQALNYTLASTKNKLQDALIDEIADDQEKIKEIDTAIQLINKMKLNLHNVDDVESK